MYQIVYYSNDTFLSCEQMQSIQAHWNWLVSLDICNSSLWLCSRILDHIHCKNVSLVYLFIISTWTWSFLLLIYLFRLVGVGEASFISLAAPFVIDNAPPDKVILCNICVLLNILSICNECICWIYGCLWWLLFYFRKQHGFLSSTCVFLLEWLWVMSMEVW